MRDFIETLLEIIAIVILWKILLFVWAAVPKLVESGGGAVQITITNRQ